ncbi:MAG: lipopolysaccharide kinase InaA family protein [Pseudomonadota bacterium]|nr:lipopolysaccharide kinase InaA family protein [Pseudomonadota bacterium]
MERRGGRLVSGGRSSQVYLFCDSGERFFLKRYLYKKIHWNFCWQKSQVCREYENLEKIRRCNLPCGVIEILGWGEQRYFRTVIDAFLLSRELAGGERLSLFLYDREDLRRQAVIKALVKLIEAIIDQGLALTDLFFRNIMVVPETAELYLLDVQYCNHSKRRALSKSYPQFWSNVLLFCTHEEQRQIEERLALRLAKKIHKVVERAHFFMPKERKRQQAESKSLEGICAP